MYGTNVYLTMRLLVEVVKAVPTKLKHKWIVFQKSWLSNY